MIKPVFDELAAERPKRHFTVGIYDDVTHLSLPIDAEFRRPRPAGEVQAVFFGLGSDGTVGANKASVKIIGEGTDLHAQGYFVYDSKKSGGVTVSHLRFGPEPIRSAYLIDAADFVACHQFGLLEKTDVLDFAKPGATFLLNSPFGPAEVWDHLPREVQQQLIDKSIDLWVIDAFAVATEVGMGKPHQHGDAAVLLPPRQRAAADRGDRPDQGERREDLREARPGRRRAQLRRHRPLDRAAEPRAARHRADRRPIPPVVPADAPDFVGPSPPSSWPGAATCCR